MLWAQNEKRMTVCTQQTTKNTSQHYVVTDFCVQTAFSDVESKIGQLKQIIDIFQLNRSLYEVIEGEWMT